jgi:hypothetical protein
MVNLKVLGLTSPLDLSLELALMPKVAPGQVDQCGVIPAICLERGMTVVSHILVSRRFELMIEPGGGHVQADTDTPYPRIEGRGMSTSWTPWQDGAPGEEDYRISLGHRGRMREGRV